MQRATRCSTHLDDDAGGLIEVAHGRVRRLDVQVVVVAHLLAPVQLRRRHARAAQLRQRPKADLGSISIGVLNTQRGFRQDFNRVQ